MRTWLLAALLVGTSASAEIAGETPRSMMAELKLGPYIPLIDRAFTGDTKGPYQEFFNDSPMLLGELSVEFQLFQKLGVLSAGVSVGYAEKFAHARTSTGDFATQSTGFRVAPLKASLVYRFDYARVRWGVPLVPYLKGGLVMIPWWVTNGPNIEVADSRRGAGFNTGFHGTVGVAFLLDVLDQRLSRDFDTTMGVNHTFLFAEYAVQEVTDFGRRNVMDLSSRHWMFGLAFEF